MRAMSDESRQRDAVVSKVAWRLVPLLALLYFAAFLDRVNIGFAALTMNADLGMSAAAYGTGAGIFFLGYVLFEVPSNLILEKVGARIWIARILITWGVISATTSLVIGVKSFYIVRFLLGVAEAGFYPGVMLYLTYWFPATYRGRIIGLFLVAIPLSGIIGSPLSGMLLGFSGFGLKGWQWLFILESLPAIVLGIVVLICLPDRPENATWLAPDERRHLAAAIEQDALSDTTRHEERILTTLLRPRVWVLCAINFGVTVGLYGFSFWLPQVIKSLGSLSNQQVGFLTAIPAIAEVFAMYLWGRHSDATGDRAWHVALAAFVGAALLAGSVYLSANPLLAFVALSLSVAAIFAIFPPFWALAGSSVSGRAVAGALAAISAVGNIGGYVGPSLIGILREQTKSYDIPLLALAAVMLVTGILAIGTARWREVK